MLSDAYIRRAKPRAKAYKIYDADGLFLFVTPAGAKIWRVKYHENQGNDQKYKTPVPGKDFVM